MTQQETVPKIGSSLGEASKAIRRPFAIAKPAVDDSDFEPDDLLAQIIDREQTEAEQNMHVPPSDSNHPPSI